MKETREKTIKNKIFTKQDIRNVWDMINVEYQVSLKEKNHSWLKLRFSCVDGTSYESETNDLLKDGDIIDIKKVTIINIHYHDFKLERGIEAVLRHGDNYGKFTAEGADRNWVGGIFKKFEDLIESVKPQQHWFVKYKTVILYVSAIILGFPILEFIAFVSEPAQNPTETQQAVRDFIHTYPMIRYSGLLSFYWSIGILPAWFFRDWVLTLWPSIEFDFGPEHQKIEKSRRKRLGLFFSVIIVPLIINSIYDWIASHV